MILLSLALATLSHAALPPRVATMQVTYTSGTYRPVQNGTLEVRYDGNDAPQSLTFTAAGRKITAFVWHTEDSRCGERIFARLTTGEVTELTLVDYTAVSCRRFFPHTWQARLETRDSDGTDSVLEMEGSPR